MSTSVIQHLSSTARNNEIDLYKDEFLSDLKYRVSGSSLRTYRYNLSIFIEYLKKTDTVNKSNNHLLEYRQYLIDTYSPRTVNLLLSTVRRLYSYLYKNEIIPNNPSTEIKNVKETNTLIKSALSKEQVQIIIENLSHDTSRYGKRNRALFILLVMNGLRIGEASTAKIEDFGVIQGSNVLYLKRKGYTSKAAYVKLQDRTYSTLIEYLNGRKEGYIFENTRTSGKISSDSLSTVIKKILRENGFDSKKYSCHSLRHTYALLSLEGGANLIGLQHSMNHLRTGTTIQYLNSYNRIKNAAEDAVHLDF